MAWNSTSLLYHCFHRSEVWWVWLVSTEGLKTKSRCWQGCISFQRLQDKNCFPTYFNYRHNSVPASFDYRYNSMQTKVPTSLLAITPDLFLVLKSLPLFYLMTPFLCLQRQQWWVKSSHSHNSNLSCFSCCIFPINSLLFHFHFKGQCHYIEHTWII